MEGQSTLPGPNRIPVLGNIHQLYRRDLLDWFETFPQQYGDVARVDLAGRDVVLLTDPDDIQEVLVNENQKYRKSGFHKFLTSSLIGEGLVLSDGDRWREHRHDLEPAFHPGKMERYAQRIQTHTDCKLDQWVDGDVVDFEMEMKELTLRIIVDALFDIDIRSEDWDLPGIFDGIIQYFAYIAQTYLYVPGWVPTSRNRAYQKAINDLNEIVEEIIQRQKREPNEYESIVVELVEKDGWSEKDIRDEIVTLLLAGHETTALMLSYAVYLVGRHPKIVDDVQREVDVFDVQDLISPSPDCGQIDSVLKESMRLYPPAYAIFRQAKTDVRLGGYRVPESTIICLSQWVTHRDSRLYPAPGEFKPDRWTSEFEAELTPGRYFPFAAGPRRCIGERLAMLEGRIVLGELLQRFTPKTASPIPLEVVPSLSTQPEESIRIELHQR